MEEHRLKVFKNVVLWNIFGHRRQELTGDCRKLHVEELNDLYSSSSSSSLAQQHLVGPGLLKKLCPFVSVEGDFLCDVVPGRSVRF